MYCTVLRTMNHIAALFCVVLFPAATIAADTQLSSGRAAKISDEGLMVDLVAPGHPKRALVPGDSVDINWYSRKDFDDSEWRLCENEPGGIGFDRDGDYSAYMSLDLGGMPNTTCYIRMTFMLDKDILDALDYLVLRMRFDDGFVAYLNGRRVAAYNATDGPKWYSNAVQPHEASYVESFIISGHLDALVPGKNLLAIHGMNVSRDSPDFLILPQLVGRKNYNDHFESRLPIFDMHTENGRGISVETASSAQMGTIGQNDDKLKKISDPYEQTLSIHVLRKKNPFEYPKKSFTFETVGDDGAVSERDILGIEGDRWVLHAPYSDKSLTRNALAGCLARFMDRDYYQGRFCHLFVNGEYEGIYLFREKLSAADVALTPPAREDISGDALTGGYMLQLDRFYRDTGFTSEFSPRPDRYDEIFYRFYIPDFSVMAAEQKDYAKRFIDDFETALSSVDFPASNGNTAPLFNLSSFVDYFILNEMAKNVYAYRANSAVFKKRDSIDPQIHIETLWDFHHAFGNNDRFGGQTVTGWSLISMLDDDRVALDSLQIPFWWEKLYYDPVFLKAVYERYRQIRSDFLDEIDVNILFDSLYFELKGPQVLNYERWPVIGRKIDPNDHVGGSFDEDFDHLLVWFLDRLEWMDIAMEPFKTGVSGKIPDRVPEQMTVYQNYPNPFNAQTVITMRLDRPADIKISIYNVTGQIVKQAVRPGVPGGLTRFVWDGRDQNQQVVSDGVYYCRLASGDEHRTIKMVVLK